MIAVAGALTLSRGVRVVDPTPGPTTPSVAFSRQKGLLVVGLAAVVRVSLTPPPPSPTPSLPPSRSRLHYPNPMCAPTTGGGSPTLVVPSLQPPTSVNTRCKKNEGGKSARRRSRHYRQGAQQQQQQRCYWCWWCCFAPKGSDDRHRRRAPPTLPRPPPKQRFFGACGGNWGAITGCPSGYRGDEEHSLGGGGWGDELRCRAVRGNAWRG